MSHAVKIAISINPSLLNRLDQFVKNHVFKNRSQAIQAAVVKIVENLEHQRLAIESAKLDPNFERKLADEGLAEDSDTWPHY